MCIYQYHNGVRIVRKLLIADDERTIREGMAKSIDWKAIGISSVILAADGREAVKVIEKHNPDIAIVDIIMPELTGLEVISHFSDMADKPEFVILSGYDEFSYAKEAIRNNVKDYLIKPCDTSELTATIQKVVNVLDERSARENKWKQLQQQLEYIRPQAMEQVWRNFLLGQPTTEQNDPEFLSCMLHHNCNEFQMVLFVPEGYDNVSLLNIIKDCVNMVNNIQGWNLSIVLGDCVALVFDSNKINEVKSSIPKITAMAGRRGLGKIRTILSRCGGIHSLKEIFSEAHSIIQLYPYHSIDNDSCSAFTIDVSSFHQSSMIQKIMKYVKDNLSNRNLSLNYIASNVLYMNPDYLGKLFKKECGMKFSDYLMSTRMEKAKKLIRTAADLKLYEIANMLGFSVDATYFSQSFYKYTGMLPSEFRQMAQNQKTNKGI